MPVSVLGLDGNPWTQRDMDGSSNNVVTTYHQLGFTGSYTTGQHGDVLDLSGVAAQVPTGMLPLEITESMNGPAGSFSELGGYLQIQKGNALNNNRIKFFAAGGAEIGSQTYAAANITADLITLAITWRKLLQN